MLDLRKPQLTLEGYLLGSITILPAAIRSVVRGNITPLTLHLTYGFVMEWETFIS